MSIMTTYAERARIARERRAQAENDLAAARLIALGYNPVVARQHASVAPRRAPFAPFVVRVRRWFVDHRRTIGRTVLTAALAVVTTWLAVVVMGMLALAIVFGVTGQ